MVFRIIRPDSLDIWNNEQILDRFFRYRAILNGKLPARYLIAKTLECNFNPNDEIETLETLFKEKSSELNQLLKLDLDDLQNRETKSPSYIDLAEIIANRYLESCIFCERKCHKNRTKEEPGFCMILKDSYISSAFLHYGEEAPLIPSGTIFFQGCNFGCVFCQNYDISQAWKGRRELWDVAQKTSPKQLAEIHHYETIEWRDYNNQLITKAGQVVDESFKVEYLIGGQIKTVSPIRSVSYFEWEVQKNDDKRVIDLVKTEFVDTVLRDFEKIMKYGKSSQYINNSLKKTENTRIIG